ncbi:MAG: aspartate--tRNA(Asn) ligase [Candidatus Parcubacteria bacterium]|nr:aspartate--tRNA(Asn) ligase [Candidatus Parcubacteria bacterium]
MYKNRVLSSELGKYIGQKVLVAGWLHNKREMGGMTFIILRDRHGLIQILDEKSVEAKKLKKLQNGTVISVKGNIVKDKRAPNGVEIHDPIIIVDVPINDVAPIEVDKPIDHSPSNLETLFENKTLNIRNVVERGIWKIQAGIGDHIRDFCKAKDFVEFHSPKLLAEATEGGAEVFKLDYFGKQASLAQSAQFYKQMMVPSLERVFEFSSTYRAEPSVTTRHMTEFITVDAEMGFIDDFGDIKDFLSELLNYVVKKIWITHKKELQALKATEPKLTKKLPEIPMRELHELYLKETGNDCRQEKDPIPAEERFICEYSVKKWKSEAVFITEFPTSYMKFYHYKNEKNPTVADRADLIFRGVEIATLTRREHRYDKLVEQLKHIGGNPDHPGYKYYLQAFKYGMPSEGGFGLGLERLTAKIIGLQNVKEASLFPRDTSRLAP